MSSSKLRIVSDMPYDDDQYSLTSKKEGTEESTEEKRETSFETFEAFSEESVILTRVFEEEKSSKEIFEEESVVKASFTFPWESLKSYYHMMKDFQKFCGSEQPNSVKADMDGLATADLLLKYAEFIKIMEEKRKELHDKTNGFTCPLFKKCLDIKTTMFKNWGGNLVESNGLMLYAKPKHVTQVQNAIKAAKTLGIKVGFGGAYHSWSPLFPEKCTENQFSLLLNMCDLELQEGKRIKLIGEVATGDAYVTISPGVTTGELMDFFLNNGVCFESDVILQSVTYGGVINTGCHGVGKDQQVLADWITQLKIVDHNGDIKTYPDDAPNVLHDGTPITSKEIMDAVKINFGMFGAVIEMTVKVQKAVTAKVTTSYPTVGSLLYGVNPELLDLMRSNWSLEILWFPFNSLGLMGGLLEGLPIFSIWQPKLDKVWVRAINRDDTFCEANKMEKMKQKISDTLQHKVLGEVVNPVMSRYHTLTPALIASGFNLVELANPPGTTLEPLPYAIHFRYGISLGPAYDMEFGFPLNLDKNDDLMMKLLKAMRYVVERSHSYAKEFIGEYPLSATMELRIIAKSDCLLCPASKMGHDDTSTHTAYLEILSFTGTKNYRKLFNDVGKKWMELGGLPHWCKQWSFLGDEIISHIHSKYGDNLRKYREVLKTLCREGDGVNEMFINSTMKTVIGL